MIWTQIAILGFIFIQTGHSMALQNATVYQPTCVGHSGDIALSNSPYWGNETVFEIPELNGTAFCTGGEDPDSWDVCTSEYFIGDVYAVIAMELVFNPDEGDDNGVLADHTMCMYTIEYEVADDSELLTPTATDEPCTKREILQCCGWEDDGDLDIQISYDNTTGELLDVDWSCGESHTNVCRPPTDATNYTILDRDEYKSFWYNEMDGSSIEASCECFFEYIDDCTMSSTTTDAPTMATTMSATQTTATGMMTTTDMGMTTDAPTAQAVNEPSSATTEAPSVARRETTGAPTVDDTGVVNNQNTEPAGDDASSAPSMFHHKSIHFVVHIAILMVVSLIAVA